MLFCQSVHFHWELVSYVVVFRNNVLSRYVGHILVVLDWDAGDIQALLSHITALINQHSLCCNSNKLSIQGNYDRPSWSRLSSDF